MTFDEAVEAQADNEDQYRAYREEILKAGTAL
jgi:hypothetical protein